MSEGEMMRALDVARALAGASDGAAVLDRLGTVLARRDAMSARVWHVLLHGGLLPQLARRFEQGGLPGSDRGCVAEALRSALEVNSVRNAVLRKHGVEASRALHAAGLTPLWVKGLWLAHAVYRPPSLRVMSDIDLFVPAGRRRDACAVLQQIGFTRSAADTQDGAAAWTDTLARPASLPGGASSVELDLHDHVHLSATRMWPVGTLWESASLVRVAGTPVWMPNLEAGLLYMAVHLFKHGFDLRHALVAVGDTVVLLEAAGDRLDADWIETHTRGTREAAALYMLLSQARALPTAAGRAVFERLTRRVEAMGLRRRADTLLASADRLTLSTATDFSLFDVGGQQTPWMLLSRTVAGALRRRRHMAAADASRRAPLGRLLRRANWRYAYTTFLAGRLDASLRGTDPA